MNIPIYWNYVGHYPSIDMYEPDKLLPNDKIKLLKWYETVKNDTFDFKKEILKYCSMDVEILMKSFMKFRKLWIQIFNIDVTTRCISLA